MSAVSVGQVVKATVRFKHSGRRFRTGPLDLIFLKNIVRIPAVVWSSERRPRKAGILCFFFTVSSTMAPKCSQFPI